MPPFIFDLIYREFMRARLAEMRKQLLLIRRDVEEIPIDLTAAADQGDLQHEAPRPSRHAERCRRTAAAAAELSNEPISRPQSHDD